MSKPCYHDTVKVLQGRDGDARSPFARAEWFALLADTGDVTPLVVANEDAAWPLMRKPDGGLNALANWYSFVWQPIGNTAAFPDLAACVKNKATRITLAPLPDEDLTAEIAKPISGLRLAVIPSLLQPDESAAAGAAEKQRDVRARFDLRCRSRV